MLTPPRLAALAALSVALAVPLSCADYRVCEEPPPIARAQLPERLSATGLYALDGAGAIVRDDAGAPVLADGVVRFTPRFALWSDGAAKERYVALPAGSTIDTSDMDAWSFPVGTRLYKAFVRDDVLVETRLLARYGTGDDDWAAAAYLWAEDGRDATLALDGAENARGTAHDVPAARDCWGCHAGTASRVLGFSAIQLGTDGRAPDAGGLDLAGLVEEGRLSHLPRDTALALPGDATERAALGYLHANCAHCHHQGRPAPTGARCFYPGIDELDFSLSVDALHEPAATAAYRVAARSAFIVPGQSEESFLLEVMGARSAFFPSMPPLGTEEVDDEAVALVRRWIDGPLAARGQP